MKAFLILVFSLLTFQYVYAQYPVNRSGVSIVEGGGVVAWTVGETYEIGDLVYTPDNKIFAATALHVASPSFDTDLANWQVLSEQLNDSERQVTLNTMSTGNLSGGILSIGVPNTTISISAGVGYVVDNTTDPNVPSITRVEFGPFDNVALTNLGTTPFTLLSIDSSGALVQSNTIVGRDFLRDHILIGSAIHLGNTIVEEVTATVNPMYDVALSVSDFSNAIGVVNTSGNVYSAASNDMTIAKSAGSIFSYGIAPVTPKNPHNLDNAVQNPVTDILYGYRNGSGGYITTSPVNVIDGTKYDDGSGTLANVSNNSFSIQRIYFRPSIGKTMVVYGSDTYSSQLNAERAILNEEVDVNPLFTSRSIFRGWLLVKGNASDLSDSSQAKFIAAGKFGESGNGISGGGISDLQVTYDNSTQPQIVLDSTRNGLQILDNSTPLGGPLFEIMSFDQVETYFSVDATGTTTQNLLVDGTLQTNSNAQVNGRFEVLTNSEASAPCPKMTEVQRDAIINRQSGDCVFNSDTLTLNVFNGITWEEVGKSVLTTDGDLYYYNSGDARLPVGTQGQLLSVDSGNLSWIDAPVSTLQGVYDEDDGAIALDFSKGAIELSDPAEDFASTHMFKVSSGATTRFTVGDLGITLENGVSADGIYDEDNMSSDSATGLATQQSIKAYVDANRQPLETENIVFNPSFELEGVNGTCTGCAANIVTVNNLDIPNNTQNLSLSGVGGYNYKDIYTHDDDLEGKQGYLEVYIRNSYTADQADRYLSVIVDGVVGSSLNVDKVNLDLNDGSPWEKYTIPFVFGNTSIGYAITNDAVASTTLQVDFVRITVGDQTKNVQMISKWKPYTPTTQGFGTITNNTLEWRQVGSNVEIRGGFTTAAAIGVEAQIGLPNNFTVKQKVGVAQVSGEIHRNALTETPYTALTTSLDAFVNIGYRSAGSASTFTPTIASSLFGVGERISINASIPVNELSAASDTIVSQKTELPVVSASGNGATPYTANVTDLPFNEVEDKGAIWDGDQLRPSESGNYLVTGGIRSGAVGNNIDVYVDVGGLGSPTLKTRIGTAYSTSGTASFAGVVKLNKGDVLSLRSSASSTLVNSNMHSLHIQKIPDEAYIAGKFENINTSDLTTVTGRGSAVSLTVSANTPIPFTEETDPFNAWDGDEFTARNTGILRVSGSIGLSILAAPQISVVVAGVKYLVTVGSSDAVKTFSADVPVKKGDKVSVQSSLALTLYGLGDYVHWITFSEQPNTESVIFNAMDGVSDAQKCLAARYNETEWKCGLWNGKTLYRRCFTVDSDIEAGDGSVVIATWDMNLQPVNATTIDADRYALKAFTADGTSSAVTLLKYTKSTGKVDGFAGNIYVLAAGVSHCMEYTR